MKSKLHLYLISWNCARIPGVTPPFTEHILGGIPDGSPVPDILVLALQEAAPISYAFLGGKYLDPYIQGYVTAIQNATRAVLRREYTLVASNNVGMTVVLVFVKDGNLDKVKTVDYGGVGCGLWEMGNKGGVAVKVTYEIPEGGDDGWSDTNAVELNFVGAHLAPHEWLVERRNQDWETIVRGLVFEKGQQPQAEDGSQPLLSDTGMETAAPDMRDVGIYSPNAHTFFMGDLNYRTAFSRPTETDRLLFPQPRDQSNDIPKLFERDQCHLERISGRTLQGFTEAQINFPPTYKYKVKKGRQYNSSHWEWSADRWPSWTDRILYLPWNSVYGEDASEPQDEIVVHRYTSIPQIMDSDHKPVTCYLSIPARPLYVRHDASSAVDALRNRDIRFHPPYPINPNWKERRAAARAREVAVGVAAFLTTTNTGVGILISVVGGFWGLWWLLSGPSSLWG
ncbi:Endonuclease/exonuclease/phosphatase [Tirmania nivea]|nr:Endonuclease/exonuclease/phosphatase [Tirmania nivea]